MKLLIDCWQHLPESVNPTLIAIGSFQIRYYSVMYLVAFFITYLLVTYRVKNEGYPYSKEIIQDSFLWIIVGLIVGARVGYVLFYNLPYYLGHPLEIIFPFDSSDGLRFTGISGMSYHGGAIGVLCAAILFCRKHTIGFFRYADLFCAAIPLGYTFGRIGNFINGELFGRATTLPWGMYFPLDPTQQLRHPSQLYEALFEGVVLFIVLWSVRKKPFGDGVLFALYFIGYGLVRFVIEFFREADPQVGLFLGTLTMGQLLCLGMIVFGIGFILYRRVRPSAAR